ncbi:MAG: hypothetical protein M1485_05445 [Chloroflexi bacterium]|nr:hypothetical protein [Chloroflexota bacterium]
MDSRAQSEANSIPKPSTNFSRIPELCAVHSFIRFPHSWTAFPSAHTDTPAETQNPPQALHCDRRECRSGQPPPTISGLPFARRHPFIRSPSVDHHPRRTDSLSLSKALR